MSTLKYLRVKWFYSLMRPFSRRNRANRMRLFVQTMQPQPGMRVLDLGGQPAIWDSVEMPLNITCLNLPGIATVDHPTHHHIAYVEGDACHMPNYEPGDFDLVFSNSVIEHVGDESKQREFSSEVRRLSPRYWVQTPSIAFPIEAHCGMPFWWFYPEWLRQYLIRKWSERLPAWTEMVATSRVIRRKTLQQMYPEATIKTEWFIFPKSLIAFANPRVDAKLPIQGRAARPHLATPRARGAKRN